MGFSIAFEFMGKPATISVDTIDELSQLMRYGNGVKTRTTATKRAPKYREPKGRGPNAPTRKNNKPASKTKKTGSRGWGPDVYDLAKARNISAGQARSIIAKDKKKKAATKKPAAA